MVSLAQSAQDMLKAVVESAKSELNSSGNAKEAIGSQSAKPLLERKKLLYLFREMMDKSCFVFIRYYFQYSSLLILVLHFYLVFLCFKGTLYILKLC